MLLFVGGELLADQGRRLQVWGELDPLEMGRLLRLANRPRTTALVTSALAPGMAASQPLADPARNHGVSVGRNAALSAE
jgi:hypothetical protein